MFLLAAINSATIETAISNTITETSEAITKPFEEARTITGEVFPSYTEWVQDKGFGYIISPIASYQEYQKKKSEFITTQNLAAHAHVVDTLADLEQRALEALAQHNAAQQALTEFTNPNREFFEDLDLNLQM